jgi:serine/threonine-protein kinase RsbW
MNAVRLSLELKNDLAELDYLTGSMEKFCETHGLTSKNNFELTLALDEVFTNIITYGYNDEKEHRIKIDVLKKGEVITIRIEDDGAPFDPTKAKKQNVACSLEDCRIGGLGLHLINRLMTRVKYQRIENKNILILEKCLAGP